MHICKSSKVQLYGKYEGPKGFHSANISQKNAVHDSEEATDSRSTHKLNNSERSGDADTHAKHIEDNSKTLISLIDLYLLADKLIDPTTANLVIDQLVSFVSKEPWVPSSVVVKRVYKSTVDGNPLRKFLRDTCLHQADVTSWGKTAKGSWGLPHEFLQDLLIELARLHKGELSFGKLCKDFHSRNPGHYHQSVEEIRIS